MKKLLVHISMAGVVAAGCVQVAFAGAEDPPPSAREVLERSIEAMGGREAIESIQSARVVLTSDEGNPARQILYWAEQQRFLMVSRGDRASNVTGSDGEYFWQHTVGEEYSDLRIMPAEPMSDRYRARTEYHRLLINLAEAPGLRESAERARDNDRPAWRVHVQYEDGRTETALICAERFELIELSIYQSGLNDPEKSRTVTRYEDWQNVGPIRLFSQSTLRYDGRTTSFRIQAQFDDVSPDVFQRPSDAFEAHEHERLLIQQERQFLERLPDMTDEEARAELENVARQRRDVRGTRAEETLIRRFALLLNHLRNQLGEGESRP